MATAFCMKCRVKREMTSASPYTMKNGRAATKGKCSKCGTGMFRIGGTAAKKATTKRAPARKPAAKRTVAKRAPARKPAAKRVVKRAPARKPAAKRRTTARR